MKNLKRRSARSLLLLSCMLFVHLTVWAQELRMDARFNNKPASEVLEYLNRQSHKQFFYSNTAVNTDKLITLNIQDGTLEEILQLLAEQLNVDFEIKDKVIALSPREEVKSKKADASEAQTVQKQKITGRVTDNNGEGVVSATISYLDQGVLKGALTDYDGNFSLEVPGTVKTIKISMIGYEDFTLNLNGQASYPITLNEKSEGLDEVVITGFQNVDRREFTGSVKKIEMEDIRQGGTETVDKMLQGQVAGVQIENVSGTTGSRTKIRIRGNSSLSGNREPLWVVDGIVLEDAVKIDPNELYSGDPATLISSAIGGINPNDIESISILKDASATALYGTQAVNGVIVISTKQGKKDQFSINYASNFTTSAKPKYKNFYMMNSNQRVELSEEMYEKDLISFSSLDYYSGGWGEALKKYNNKEYTEEEFQQEVYRIKKGNTDWLDLLFKNTFRMEHNLSISSGTDKSQYYFSVNYFKDLGNTLGQNTDRFIANFRSNYDLSDKLKVGAKVNVSNKEQRIFNSNANPYTYAINTSRAIPQYNADGSDFYYTYGYAPMNIFSEIENSFSNLSSLDATMQVDLNWEIIKGLNFSSIISYRNAYSHSEKIYTENSNVAETYRQNIYTYYQDSDDDDAPLEGVTILPRGGILQTLDNRSKFFTNRNALAWQKVLGKHKIDLYAGEEYRSSIYSDGYLTGWGYEYYRGRTANPTYLPIKMDQDYNNSPYYGLNTSPAYKFSLFGTATYSYMGKYTINFNMRSDGSNQFGDAAKFRFLPIWSVGGNWNLTQENFMSSQEFFTNLALRGSFGLRGNISGSYTPQLLAYYGLSYALDVEDQEEVLYITDPENPNLQWEKEYISNIALDFDIRNRVNGSVEFYNRSNYDLISDYPVSYVSGFQSVNLNWASMRNRGVELSLTTRNVVQPKFSWSTNFTFGYNENEVMEAFYVPTVETLADETVVAPMVGRSMTGIYAFRYAGLDEEGIPMVYNSANEKVYGFDLASTQEIDALEYMGSREPLYSGGITNTFNYKDFSLSFLIVYSGGNVIRMNDVYSFYYQDVFNVSGEMVNRWQLPGDEQYTDVPAILDLAQQTELYQAGYEVDFMYNNSNIRVVNGSYLKLRNVTLGWNFVPKNAAEKTIKNFQVQLQGQNLFTLADKELNGKDPEVLIQGSSLPLVATYTLGLKASF